MINCNLGDGGWSLRNFTGHVRYTLASYLEAFFPQFQDIDCNLQDCIVDLGNIHDECGRNDVTSQINEGSYIVGRAR